MMAGSGRKRTFDPGPVEEWRVAMWEGERGVEVLSTRLGCFFDDSIDLVRYFGGGTIDAFRVEQFLLLLLATDRRSCLLASLACCTYRDD